MTTIISISLPPGVLDRLDVIAGRRGISRSKFISEMLERFMDDHDNRDARDREAAEREHERAFSPDEAMKKLDELISEKHGDARAIMKSALMYIHLDAIELIARAIRNHRIRYVPWSRMLFSNARIDPVTRAPVPGQFQRNDTADIDRWIRDIRGLMA